MFLASGYTSAETAQLLALSEVEAKVIASEYYEKTAGEK